MANKSTKIRTLWVKLEPVELILTHSQDRASLRKIKLVMH